jgi:hypothetical protein
MRAGLSQLHRAVFLVCAAIGISSGCGSPFDPDSTDEPARSLEFAPQSKNRDINLDRDHDANDKHAFTVFVVAKGYRLAAAGKCANAPDCGHLLLHIDGTACGDPNDLSTDERLHARFGRCPSVRGLHLITIRLRDDSERLLATTELEVVVTSTG